MMLILSYRPLLIREKPTKKQVTVCTEGAMSALEDCFEHTDWEMFKKVATENHHTIVGEYAASVSAYIHIGVEDVCVTKNVTTQANQKTLKNQQGM